MKQVYFFSSIILLLASCSPRINYLGTTSDPTSEVDVFVDESAIKKNYDIIGKGYVDTRLPGRNSHEKIQSKAIEKAMKKGADAILIQDYFTGNGTTVNTTAKKDAISKDVITVRNTNVQPAGENGFVVYFLKYTK